MLYVNRQSIQFGWCVYTLTLANNPRPEFIWYCKFASVIAAVDALKNPDFSSTATYRLDIFGHYPDKMTAYNATSKYLKENGMPPLNLTQWFNRRQPIQCDQTGQRFKNAAEAATLLGLNRSQLSQHLRRNAGYKTIKGMTFTNVTEQSERQAGAVQFPQRQAPMNAPAPHKPLVGLMPTVEDFNLDVSIQPRSQ